MADRSLREALERRLGSLPVMTNENGYPVQALPKAELLALLRMHSTQTDGGAPAAAGGSAPHVPPSDGGARVPGGVLTTASGAPAPPSPSFEQLLAAPHEQFDVNSEVTPYLLQLGVPPQSRTLAASLCDPDGVVRSGAMHHGTDYQCTGSAHFDGVYIRCTSPAHTPTAGGEVQPGGTPTGAGTPDAASAEPAPSSPTPIEELVGILAPFYDAIRTTLPKPMCAACEADMEAPMCNACYAYSRSLEVARNIVNQLADLWNVPVDTRQATNDQADAFVADRVSERLGAPPVRPLALHRDQVARIHHEFHCPRTCRGGGCAGPDEVDEEFADVILATAVDLDSEAVVDRIAQAIGDPGSFLARGDNYQETIPRWSTRAVLHVLAGGRE